jgi:GNAT superfamily N-acetyltransferase
MTAMTASVLPATSITAAAPSDASRIAEMLTLAFSADPAARWVYPDAHQYLTYWHQFVVAFAGAAFEHGTAHVAADRTGTWAGASLWLPPGVHTDDDALTPLLLRSIAERDHEPVFATFEAMAAYHPTEPHWYLPLIGVDPSRQGEGYGSALLGHALTVCDRDRTPAYLEATSPGSRQLYERHGFEVLGVIQLGEAPSIWPMLRRPRASWGVL